MVGRRLSWVLIEMYKAQEDFRMIGCDELAYATRRVESIFYCHGFASHFDPQKQKIRFLARLAPVCGVTVDYTDPPERVFNVFSRTLGACSHPLVVGTSMGGYFAAWLGGEFGCPFISINPVISPSKSLRKYIGDGRTHFGKHYTLTAEAVAAYADFPFRLDEKGLIVVDLEDEVIDAQMTISVVKDRTQIIAFDGGSHRFDHMPTLVKLLCTRFHWSNQSPPRMSEE